MRARPLAPLALIACLLLTGCSDDGKAYCEAVKDSSFSGGGSGKSGFSQWAEDVHEIASSAPSEFADVWDDLDTAVNEQHDLMEQHGIDNTAEMIPGSKALGALSAADQEQLQKAAATSAEAFSRVGTSDMQDDLTKRCGSDVFS